MTIAVLTVKKNYYMHGYKTKEKNKQTRNNTCGLIQSQAFLCRHFHFSEHLGLLTL